MDVKSGECCVCGNPCIWLSTDGIYYEVEVCDYVCLEELKREIADPTIIISPAGDDELDEYLNGK